MKWLTGVLIVGLIGVAGCSADRTSVSTDPVEQPLELNPNFDTPPTELVQCDPADPLVAFLEGGPYIPGAGPDAQRATPEASFRIVVARTYPRLMRHIEEGRAELRREASGTKSGRPAVRLAVEMDGKNRAVAVMTEYAVGTWYLEALAACSVQAGVEGSPPPS